MKKQSITDSNLHVCVGFDVSSETVGIGVIYLLNDKIIDIKYEYYKPLDKKVDELKSIFALYGFICRRLYEIYDEGCLLAEDNKAKFNFQVFVENYLLFMEGRSTAKTITTLCVYNRTVCLAIFNSRAIIPMLLPVVTIRSVLKKLSNGSERIDKEHVPEALENIVNQFWAGEKKWIFDFEYKRNKKPKAECYDMADGIAVSLAGMFKTGLIKVKK